MSTASTCGSVILPDEVSCEGIRFRLAGLVSVEIVIHNLSSFCDVVFSGASRDHRHIMPFYGWKAESHDGMACYHDGYK